MISIKFIIPTILLLLIFSNNVNSFTNKYFELKLKDNDSSYYKSVSIGTGLYYCKAMYQNIFGYYVSANYTTNPISDYYLGYCLDVFNKTNYYEKPTTFYFGVNPMYGKNFFKNKLSIYGGIYFLIAFKLGKGDGGAFGFGILLNFKIKYNFNKKYSIGIEHKANSIYESLTNLSFSFNF